MYGVKRKSCPILSVDTSVLWQVSLYYFVFLLGIVQLSCNRRVITVQSCSSVFCDLEFIGQIVRPRAVTLG